ncbi:MAG: phosphotransferase family protein [Planctomycetota bacterium]|jgi:hypothetical protein
MTTACPELPDVDTLAAVLRATLGAASDGAVEITDRRRTIQGTFPKEIVTCRIDGGPGRRVFCKYSGVNHDAHGHRGGVTYEADVYRRLLAPMGARTPVLHGVHEDDAGRTWLILEYLEGGVRVHQTKEPGTLALAADWIGRFHAAAGERRSRPEFSFLSSYDAAYYRGWARRTGERARALGHRLPWLETLCAGFEAVVAALTSGPETIIHGEYYPNNIMLRDGAILPVDWESAALAAGEIDLACLCDKWPGAVQRECVARYRRARWPDRAPADFERRLDAARAYVHCRWLGDNWDRRTGDGGRGRLRDLREAGGRLGLIECPP